MRVSDFNRELKHAIKSLGFRKKCHWLNKSNENFSVYKYTRF